MTANEIIRCGWVSDDAEYQRYHDEEWGRPVTDSQQLFAKLCLDGQQAGLLRISVNSISRFGVIRSLFHLLFRPCQFYLK